VTADDAGSQDPPGERPELPRFVRDVRLTGLASDTAGLGVPWAGVRRPFGGVLAPGLPAGEWPSPVLSHLALDELLADVLGQKNSGRSDRQSGSTADGDRESHAVTGEPIVREILRTEADPEPADDVAGTTPGDVVAISADPVRMAPRESPDDRQWDDPGGQRANAGASDGVTDATGSSSGGSAIDDSPDLVVPLHGGRVAPRTVLRRGGGGTDHPTPASEHQMARLVQPDGPHSPGAGGSRDTGEPTGASELGASPGASGATAVPSMATAPPVERTVTTVPVLGAVGAGRLTTAREPHGVPDDGPAGPRPFADDSGPREEASAASDAPTMTPRRGSTDATDGRRPAGADAPSPSTRAVAGPETAETEPSGSRIESAGQSVSAGADGLDADSAGALRRSITDAVTDPRVVDQLHRELQRRRRIERERGGRP